MDTITHGIAGALIGKAVFRGGDMFGGQPLNRGRILTWSLMLGAIFPDSDVLRDIFSHDGLLIVTWHRSITHSLVMLPLWALLLAGSTRAFCNWRRWEAPSFAALSAIYGVGILSHILLDLVTTFGTMIWSPVAWSRPAWDMIFIVDFTLTAILLVPQLLAWAYAHPEKVRSRAAGVWLAFMPAPFLIARIGEAAGAPISGQTVMGAMIIFTAIFLLPALRGWGLKIRHDQWNRAGFAAALVYVALTFFAHRAALERIHKFAELDHLQVKSIGALAAGRLRTTHGFERSERKRCGLVGAGASLLSGCAAEFVHRSGRAFAGSAESVVVCAVSRDAIPQRGRRGHRGNLGCAILAFEHRAPAGVYVSRAFWRGRECGLARVGDEVGCTPRHDGNKKKNN